MKKINYKILISTCIVCLLPIILGVIFYPKLPEQVAIHFDINNTPNGYFSKTAFVFGVPLIMVALQAFCCIINDLSDKNKEANKKATTAFKWLIPILTVVLYIVTIIYSLGSTLDIRKVAMIIVGIMFMIIGNYSPKTKGMIHLGFKKLDEESDKNISRILGYLFIINGLLSLISILFNKYVSIAVITLVILEGIILSVYTLMNEKNK